MSEKMFKLAAVLDPRWKMAWCKGDESVELKRIILEKVQANKPATNSSTSESAAGSPSRRDQSFLNSWMHNHQLPRHHKLAIVSYYKWMSI